MIFKNIYELQELLGRITNGSIVRIKKYQDEDEIYEEFVYIKIFSNALTLKIVSEVDGEKEETEKEIEVKELLERLSLSEDFIFE